MIHYEYVGTKRWKKIQTAILSELEQSIWNILSRRF